MPGQADKGNPNFFTLFKGKYNAVLSGTSSTSNVIMLTSTNVVQFLGDCTADDEGNLWVLPEECRPSSPVRLVCPIEPGGDTQGQSIEVVSDVTTEVAQKSVIVGVNETPVQLISDATIEMETENALTLSTISTTDEIVISSIEANTTTDTFDSGVELTTASSDFVNGVEIQTESGSFLNGASLNSTNDTFTGSASLNITSGQVVNEVNSDIDKELVIGSPVVLTNGLTATQYDNLSSKNVVSNIEVTATKNNAVLSASLETTASKALTSASLASTRGNAVTDANVEATTAKALTSATIKSTKKESLTSVEVVSSNSSVIKTVSLSSNSNPFIKSLVLNTENTNAVGSITTKSDTIELISEPVVEKATIEIPGISASKITILVVTPDGIVKGEPNKLHYTNGLMFSISDRWYL